MEEKAMVSDTLFGINAELGSLGGIIAQTENAQLKQQLKQMRNMCEQSQEELYQMAKQKNYYEPAAPANEQEIMTVKSIFTGSGIM